MQLLTAAAAYFTVYCRSWVGSETQKEFTRGSQAWRY